MPGVRVGTQIEQRQGRGRTTSQEHEARDVSERLQTRLDPAPEAALRPHGMSAARYCRSAGPACWDRP